jgi:ribonuclease Z
MGHSVVLSGDTTYTPNLIRHAKGAELLIHCIAVGSRALEKAAPEYVARFYRYLANPETVGRVLNEVKPKLAVFSHISLYSRGDIPRATEEEINTRVRAIYSGEFILGQDLMEFTVSDRGVTAEPYDPAIRNREP